MYEITNLVGKDKTEYVKSLNTQIANKEARLKKLQSYRGSFPGENKKGEKARKKEIRQLQKTIKGLKREKSKA